MIRQIIAVLTLAAFAIFSLCCYSVREIKPAALASPRAKNMDILRLTKTSGESIVFTEDSPGRIVGDFIQGFGAMYGSLRTMEISNVEVKTINRQGDQIVSVTTQDNKTHPVQKIVQKPETIEISILEFVRPLHYERISVVMSDVKKAYAKAFSIVNTLVAIGIPVGLGAFFALSFTGSIYSAR